MKKILAMLLALVMVMSLAACAGNGSGETEANTESTEAVPTEESMEATEEATEPENDDAAVMTHDEYIAADMDAEVNIVTYVQGHQSWWEDKVTVYCQSPDGAYFLYELACSQEDAEKLVPGTKIAVHGFKGSWAGEVEIMDGTFTFVDDGDTWIAEATDVTELLGTDEMINHQNEFVAFSGLTVESVVYKNNEPGDDIYVTVGYNGVSYSFCVEAYLTGPDTDVYAAVGALNAGDVVNVEGFLYWYEGVNTHITSVTVVE